MPLYTFYPTRADGLSSSFECCELENDRDAELQALQVLDTHDSAVSVVTYCGGRKVLTRRRMDPALSATLSRGTTRPPPEPRTFSRR